MTSYTSQNMAKAICITVLEFRFGSLDVLFSYPVKSLVADFNSLGIESVCFSL